MSVFTAKDYADHEQVVFCRDPETGLKAIIAVHNRNLGPALGGCRMWPYANENEAISDVLRLSRGMTYKSALAGLALGGGKSVIIGNPRTDKTDALLKAMGRFVDSLGGRYIAAEDSGTSVADMKVMMTQTKHVSGIQDKEGGLGGKSGEHGARSGDPSPATAYGTFCGIKSAVKFAMGRKDLEGVKVAIQGVGNVGFDLARRLKEAGAQLWVTDIYGEAVKRAVDELGATAVTGDAIFGLDVDVFAPCALGAILNDQTIPQLKARIVAGAANNQLFEPRHGVELMRRGILYAPDYAINAGGIIDVFHERQGYNPERVRKHIEGIGETLATIFERARHEEKTTAEVADALAEERFRCR